MEEDKEIEGNEWSEGGRKGERKERNMYYYLFYINKGFVLEE